MTKRKKGRPRTPGAFYANGRRKQPTTKAERDDASRIPPTRETADYIERRQEYWLVPGLWNLASAEHCFDNAGILWLAGMFDDNGFPAEEIRNIFRDYASLYWRWYAQLAPQISRNERADRAEPSSHAAGWELRFQKLDKRLVGRERKAVHELAVDGWFMDDKHPNAIALANLGRLRIRARRKIDMPINGLVATEDGREMEWLKCALRGAFMLLDAKQPEREIPLWKLRAA